MFRLVGEETVVVLASDRNPCSTYERPMLTPVGNLNDLLASGGTQNADPTGGSNPPLCVSGGIVLDSDDC
jgi:hypothetical protein